jgi:tetratricopeptide (TPR) repeat protein
LRFSELLTADKGLVEWPEAQALRAEALVMRGDSRAALQAVLAVLSREPDHERALSLLETVTPDASSREWLMHRLRESAQKVPSEDARARILHRVALLHESLGLGFDALGPLEEAVFLAPDSDRFEDRASSLMALQREYGMWPDYLRIGTQRLVKMRAGGLSDEAAVQRRVELLTSLGQVALHEVGDLAAARTWLEEATRLSPRALTAQEELAETLMRSLAQARDSSRKTLAQALTGVLTRLAALRPDAAAQDEARMALAELQLDELGAAGQARAALSRLNAAPRDERGLRLLERVGLVAARPEPGEQRREQPEPKPASLAPLFDAALAAADAGRDDEARAIVAQILDRDPRHQPTLELLALLGPAPAPAPTLAPALTPAPTATLAPAPTPPPAPTSPALTPPPAPTPARPPAPPAEGPSADEEEAPLTARQLAGMSEEAGARLLEKARESDTIDELMAQAMERYFADDLDGARAHLERVLAIDGDVVGALELLQEILQAHGDHRRRAEVLNKLTERVFDAAAASTYLKALGESYELAGEHDLARAAFIRYLRSRPLDEQLFKVIARALDDDGSSQARSTLADLFEARADALEELDDARGRLMALTGAARAHFGAKNLAAAEHAAARAVAITADTPEALELLVRVALAQGHMDRARHAARQLVPLMLPGPDREWLDALAS